MIRAKNYETMSEFVKVMNEIPWPLFFRTRCIILVRQKYVSTRDLSISGFGGFLLRVIGRYRSCPNSLLYRPLQVVLTVEANVEGRVCRIKVGLNKQELTT